MEILRSFSTRSIRIAIDVMEEDLKMLLNFALQTFLTTKNIASEFAFDK